jgi:uncharacterized protein (TIRG00374 family)
LKKQLINILKFILFLGIGLVILYLVYRHQNAAYLAECELRGIPEAECSLLDKVVTDFKGANYFWILLVLIAFTVSNISRAIRWNMLLGPLGYKPRLINSFLAVVLGYFANLGFPRMGEIIRPATISRYEKVPLESAIGTIVTDRIIDVISILLLTAVVLLLEFDNIWAFLLANADLGNKLDTLTNLGIYFLLFLAVVAIISFIFRKRMMQSPLYLKVKEIALGFWEGILSIRKVKRIGVFLFHSINIWFMYFLMTWMCFFAYEPTSHLSMVAGLVVFVFGGWGVVIPSPGGMGTYHFLVIAALAIYGINGDDAFSFANIAFFSIQLGVNIFIGMLALILLPIINKDKTGAVTAVQQKA